MIANIYTLKRKMEELLLQHGVSNNHAKIIANDYWEAELNGKKTHGVNKFIKELHYLKDREDSPEITIDKGAMILVNGNKEYGQIAADYCTDLAIERAKQFGITAIGLKNVQRYGMLSPWVKKIAENDLIGIISNTCEPAAAPFGGTSKVLGSNPLAVGIPTLNEPILLDMATSKIAMSNIWDAIVENKNLANNTFYDENGEYTIDPYKAKSVETFGGYKGYGISLIVEILAGSLVTAKMGKQIESPYDIGYYFQAIDPSVFQDLLNFKTENSKFINEIKASKRKHGIHEIFLPGEQSKKVRRKNITSEFIEISKPAFETLFEIKY